MNFMDAHPRMVRQLIRLLSKYLQATDETLSEAAFYDVPGRVAQRLLDLAESHGERTADGVRITVRLSQRTLAGMVGASREMINRALSRLSARGDIALHDGYITIVRADALRRHT